MFNLDKLAEACGIKTKEDPNEKLAQTMDDIKGIVATLSEKVNSTPPTEEPDPDPNAPKEE